ncbi:quinoprotein dehydrogenase-associated probable ABC transporter substrate-binding protein/PQQ-dependent catabolism-associated CXXCW motif protein [Bradyrhizobium sp. GM6.1]
MTEAGRHRRWLLSLSILVASCAFGDVAIAQTNETGDLSFELVDPKVLRVCSDPRNLPFSNEKGEGFENKLAELFADKLQKKLDYVFFPQATGFVRMTLGSHRCDVIMGFPQGDDLVQGTNPYYRTSYALVAKTGSGLEEVDTLEDARLKGKHVGIVAGTPPATNMAIAGLMGDAKPYPLMIDTRYDNSAQAMIDDLTAGKIDAGVLWGPMAGFYAKKAGSLHVTPLVKETTGPKLVYRIGMGVRGADQNWKRQLNKLIQENQGEINKILLDFGVPCRCWTRMIGRSARRRPRRHHEADAMRRHLAAALVAAVLVAPVVAQQQEPFEPEGYRTDNYRAPVPATLGGARVLSTSEAEAIWHAKSGAFIDVLPRAPKPKNLPAGTVWREAPRKNIPGSIWLPDTGYGMLPPAMDDYFQRGLARASHGDKTALLVIYCLADCWMSWNSRQARARVWLFQRRLVSRWHRWLGACKASY